mmetsp:Transcript_5824/g.18696  ORF Transcript_5824/g.18696 Transcript_5824/m.18696 type:complete len:323 (+) Transcript_5824:195-1163(+)
MVILLPHSELRPLGNQARLRVCRLEGEATRHANEGAGNVVKWPPVQAALRGAALLVEEVGHVAGVLVGPVARPCLPHHLVVVAAPPAFVHPCDQLRNQEVELHVHLGDVVCPGIFDSHPVQEVAHLEVFVLLGGAQDHHVLLAPGVVEKEHWRTLERGAIAGGGHGKGRVEVAALLRAVLQLADVVLALPGVADHVAVHLLVGLGEYADDHLQLGPCVDMVRDAAEELHVAPVGEVRLEGLEHRQVSVDLRLWGRRLLLLEPSRPLALSLSPKGAAGEGERGQQPQGGGDRERTAHGPRASAYAAGKIVGRVAEAAEPCGRA